MVTKVQQIFERMYYRYAMDRTAADGRPPLVVGGWLADTEGVGYYRIRVPLDALERRGHSVVYRGDMPWRHGKRPPTHVLVGQRVSNPGPSRRWLYSRGEVRRVYELDDDLLNVDPTSAKARTYYGDPQLRARVLENIRSADAVTVSTDYLARVVRAEYGVQAPVYVLPNCLERHVLDVPLVDQAGAPTVGWYGSSTHRGDFERIRRPLARWLAAHPDVPMVMGGANYGALLGVDAQVRPWRPVWRDAVAYMRGIDVQIGLAPLANTQFNRCKSAIRLIEHGARGIPMIASDVEPYRRYVRHGETGFLIEHDREWPDALDALVKDPDLRVRMGAAAREQAAGWVIDDHIHLWEAAYRGEGEEG
jgi:glycosyltransferase involved in cell wall biosynthesis